MIRRLLTALCLTLVVAFASVNHATANTFWVTNTADDGPGSLRQAILNANTNPGADYIAFDITDGSCSAGVCTISPLSPLPTLMDDETSIDGYTQDGAEQANATESAIIAIHIDGASISTTSGFESGFNIASSNNLIRGLSITNFPLNGITIGSVGDYLGSNNVIVGNYIGLDPDGVTDNGNTYEGIFIGLGATNNRIGGSIPAERNVISGNNLDGVTIHGSGTVNNRVEGNYIGTDALGTGAVPNGAHGVRIYGGAEDNTIGGNDPTERNIISGNGENGVGIVGTEADTSGNMVMGNYIGTDYSGLDDLGNAECGVEIVDGVDNTIGYGNVISGNDFHGVCIQGAKATDNVITDNYIGSDASGSAALGNTGMGIYLFSSCAATSILDNVISANGSLGIWVDGSDGNFIWGNHIGVDVSGGIPLGNLSYGIAIGSGSKDNQVGSSSPANRNVISANDGYGISLSGAGTTGNTIAGNYIGLAVNGISMFGNDDGIRLENGVQDNIIGPSNVISGNNGYGIWFTDDDTSGNLVWANYIGTNASGTLARGNLYSGISIWGGASNNTIGGNVYPDSGNLISGNDENGVEITGEGAIDNKVSGNFIGTDAEGKYAIPNGDAGVMIRAGAQSNIVGGISEEERNIISGNRVGVIISDENTSGNFISGNYIGTGISRLIELGNELSGVSITFYAPNNNIGPGNTIAHNGTDGVHIDTPLAVGNLVLENSIFDNFESGIELSMGANNEILSPVIESSTTMPFRVSGSACAECLVEVFCSQDDDGEGEVPLGHTHADASGNFTLDLDWIFYPYLTATASTLVDGTSEFSAVYIAELPNYLFMPAVMR